VRSLGSEGTMRKRVFFTAAAVLCLAIAYLVGSKDAQGKPPTTLLAMTDNPRVTFSAVAIDQAGGIYFGHLNRWSRVGATPSTPTSIWTRTSSGEIFIALANGDLYRLEPDWALTYDSNVFSSQ